MHPEVALNALAGTPGLELGIQELRAQQGKMGKGTETNPPDQDLAGTAREKSWSSERHQARWELSRPSCEARSSSAQSQPDLPGEAPAAVVGSDHGGENGDKAEPGDPWETRGGFWERSSV